MPMRSTLLPTLLLLAGTISVSGPAFAETGQTCIASDNESQATCLAMVSTVRELLESDNNKDPACATRNTNDARITNDVIDWIKGHPERAGDDLGGLIREALIEIDPCAQGPLIPTPSTPSDIDVD